MTIEELKKTMGTAEWMALRVFVKLVRDRALQLDEPGGPPDSALISIAFNSIVKEFNLDRP